MRQQNKQRILRSFARRRDSSNLLWFTHWVSRYAASRSNSLELRRMFSLY